MPEPAAEPAQPTPPRSGDSGFIAKRLERVRSQLDRVDDLIDLEMDPTRLDRLASAQARLAEQERVLAGRPMPGSFRPRKISERAERGLDLSFAEPMPIVAEEMTLPPT